MIFSSDNYQQAICRKQNQHYKPFVEELFNTGEIKSNLRPFLDDGDMANIIILSLFKLYDDQVLYDNLNREILALELQVPATPLNPYYIMLREEINPLPIVIEIKEKKKQLQEMKLLYLKNQATVEKIKLLFKILPSEIQINIMRILV